MSSRPVLACAAIEPLVWCVGFGTPISCFEDSDAERIAASSSSTSSTDPNLEF